jgi:hypothetical protein
MTCKRAAGLLLLTLFFALTVLPDARAAETLTHVTTGQEKIKGQDLPGAKKKAVKQALEMAVQNAFSSLVSHQVFASNLEFLYSSLLPQASDYVVTYKVLDGIQHKGQYIVGVESKINLGLVEKRLRKARILKNGQGKPVVLLLIAEQTPGDLLPKYWWGKNPEPYVSLAETTLKAQMAQNRILFANQGKAYPDPSFYAIEFANIYDVKAAMALGVALKADMVVLGKARTSESFNRMGDEKTFEANIDLTVYDLASQQPVLQTRTSATAKSQMESQGSVEALTQASKSAGLDLGQKIDLFWSQSLRKENRFEVAIEGENFLPRFIALKRRLQDIRDIENMQPKEIGSAHAIMEVVYKGSAEQFADTVLLKTFENFGLEIIEVTPEQIKIRFVGDQEQAAGQPTEQGSVPAVNQEIIKE